MSSLAQWSHGFSVMHPPLPLSDPRYKALLECRCCSIAKSLGFPGGSVVKTPPANAGDAGSIPGSGRSPGEVNGNPLQYSCLGNPVYRGLRRATDHGVPKESDTTQQLNNCRGSRKRESQRKERLSGSMNRCS